MCAAKTAEPELKAAEISSLLSRRRDAVRARWIEVLEKGGERTRMALSHVRRELAEQTDLFSILVRRLHADPKTLTKDMQVVVDKVRLQEYQITDLFIEIRCLEAAVEHTLKCSPKVNGQEYAIITRQVRRRLADLFQTILNEAVILYEFVAESGGHGLCKIDRDDVITYVNHRMREFLGAEKLVGRKLEEFFDGVSQKFIRNALRRGIRQTQEIRITRRDGSSVTVSAEIGPLRHVKRRFGAYASFTDVSSIVERWRKIFDLSPLGIIEAELGETVRIRYANPAILKMLDASSRDELRIPEMFEDQGILERELAKRRRGESSQFEATLLSVGDRPSPVSVAVASNPILDANDKAIGVMTIIRDLRPEDVSKAVRKAIQTETDYKEMLKKVAKETHRLIEFDLFIAARFSTDNTGTTHMESILTYSYSLDRDVPSENRWNVLSPPVSRWFRGKNVDIIPDFVGFMNQEDWHAVRDDPVTQNILNLGIQSAIKIPVYQGEDIAAVIGIFHKQKNAYGEDDSRNADRLPLREAVGAALNHLERKELQFRLDLIQELAAAESVGTLAEILVRRLAEQYNCQSVSIFLVDDCKGVFRRLAEWSTGVTESVVPVDYEQALDKGILADVLRVARDKDIEECDRQRGARIDDVQTDPRYKDVYVSILPDTRFELCLPISWEGDVRWLLDVADQRASLMSEDECDNLRKILSEAGAVLNRLASLFRLQSAFGFTSDAVIFTDSNNNITKTNPAAAKLLEYDPVLVDPAKEPTVRSLEDFFPLQEEGQEEQKKERNAIFGTTILRSTEVLLRPHKGHKNDDIKVLISGCHLPEDPSGKVFAVIDLRTLKRVEELELLGQVFYEIAVQTHTPLSLAFTWLERLRNEDIPESDRIALIGKILEQMHRIQITSARMALYDKGKSLLPTNRIQLHLLTELERVRDTFPEIDREGIKIDPEADLPSVAGDPYQVSFVLETILSYLVRFRPKKATIAVNLYRSSGMLTVDIQGTVPLETTPGTGGQTFVSQMHAELALGEKIIRTFVVENHRGRYKKRRPARDKMQFQVSFPIEGT